jgi:hypothetical protein
MLHPDIEENVSYGESDPRAPQGNDESHGEQ